ncbi:reverse transcriptase domain-containing protein [Tanacetum coccineum]
MKMSAMANTTPIVTTVTKPTTKEKTPKEADATPRVNIQDFCEEHYEDILLVIMDKIRRDKRKEVHARLDFEESPKKRRIREGSQNSSAMTLSARRDSSNKDRPRSRDHSRGVEESYDNTRSSYGTGTKHGYRSRDRVALTETTPFFEKMGGKVESPSSSFPAYQKAIQRWGTLEVKRAVDGYKDLKARCLFSILPCTKESMSKIPVEIHNIKQRDGENHRGVHGMIQDHGGNDDHHHLPSMGEATCWQTRKGSHIVEETDLSKRHGLEQVPQKHWLRVPTAYQRLVDKAFDSQVGRNIEVYVDDLVIKSRTEAEMLRDIDETFRTFLSNSAERSLPLFKTLKKCIKKSDFHWTPEAKQAFKQLKQHLSELPLLVAPKPKEELIVYLSATHRAISAVLMTKKGTVQTPVYFVSRTLQGPKLNYTPMEKLVLSLVFAAKRLQSKNKKADALSKIASTRFAHLSKQVLIKILKEKSIQEKEVTTMVEEDGPTWMTPIIEYLKEGTLPDDRKEASKLSIKARQYELLEGILYRRLFLKPWL